MFKNIFRSKNSVTLIEKNTTEIKGFAKALKEVIPKIKEVGPKIITINSFIKAVRHLKYPIIYVTSYTIAKRILKKRCNSKRINFYANLISGTTLVLVITCLDGTSYHVAAKGAACFYSGIKKDFIIPKYKKLKALIKSKIFGPESVPTTQVESLPTNPYFWYHALGFGTIAMTSFLTMLAISKGWISLSNSELHVKPEIIDKKEEVIEKIIEKKEKTFNWKYMLLEFVLTVLYYYIIGAANASIYGDSNILVEPDMIPSPFPSPFTSHDLFKKYEPLVQACDLPEGCGGLGVPEDLGVLDLDKI